MIVTHDVCRYHYRKLVCNGTPFVKVVRLCRERGTVYPCKWIRWDGIYNYFCSTDLLTVIYCFINVGITIILSQNIFAIPTNLIKKYCFANVKDKNINKTLEY